MLQLPTRILDAWHLRTEIETLGPQLHLHVIRISKRGHKFPPQVQTTTRRNQLSTPSISTTPEKNHVGHLRSPVAEEDLRQVDEGGPSPLAEGEEVVPC